MTQPTFVPVADAGAVRASMATPTPEIGRAKKIGLLGAPRTFGGSGHGTPGPDAGYALTLTQLALRKVELDDGESLYDLEVGVAMLAAKRAGLCGRGPTGSDVAVALDLFGIRSAGRDFEVVQDRHRRFSGLGHSYFHQRAFVDAVSESALAQRPGSVTPLVRWQP